MIEGVAKLLTEQIDMGVRGSLDALNKHTYT